MLCSCIFISKRKDNRPDILRYRGGYLYDKGENDELFHIGYAQPIYIYYFITLDEKSKEKTKNKLKNFKIV